MRPRYGPRGSSVPAIRARRGHRPCTWPWAPTGFCNLELVGQHQGNGAEWQLTWFNDCAYYGTYNSSSNTTPGVVVLNVADPANPVQTATLTSRAMIDPWES